MYKCPNCRTSLKVSALLHMNVYEHAHCSACGQRYRWDVSGPIMLLMLALIVSSVMGLMLTAPQLNVSVLLAGIAALLGASAYMALCAFRPVIP